MPNSTSISRSDPRRFLRQPMGHRLGGLWRHSQTGLRRHSHTRLRRHSHKLRRPPRGHGLYISLAIQLRIPSIKGIFPDSSYKTKSLCKKWYVYEENAEDERQVGENQYLSTERRKQLGPTKPETSPVSWLNSYIALRSLSTLAVTDDWTPSTLLDWNFSMREHRRIWLVFFAVPDAQ